MHIDMTSAGMNPHIRPTSRHVANPDIGTATVPETVSPIGGMVTFRAAAAVVEVVSSSAADAAAGTGARTIEVHGLDADYNEISETITLNGVTAVAGAKLFLRINDVHVHTAGTGLANAGVITIRDASAGTTRSLISIGRSRSEVGVNTVPAGHTLVICHWSLTSRDATGASSADVEIWGTKNGVRTLYRTTVISGTLAVYMADAPHIWPEKTDIEIVVSRVLANSTIVSMFTRGYLIGPNADI